MANLAYVQGDRSLTDEERAKIQDIMAHSKCPNESLIESIDDCKGIQGGVIVIGDSQTLQEVIEY